MLREEADGRRDRRRGVEFQEDDRVLEARLRHEIENQRARARAEGEASRLRNRFQDRYREDSPRPAMFSYPESRDRENIQLHDPRSMHPEEQYHNGINSNHPSAVQNNEHVRNHAREAARDRIHDDIRNRVHQSIRQEDQIRKLSSVAKHRRGLFQTIYDVTSSRDVTVHLDFPVFADYEEEVEDFSRLRRLGQFEAAKILFKKAFEGHLKNPYMLVQYAEMLLDMGDYKSFDLLDGKPAFGPSLIAFDEASLGYQHIRQSRTLYDEPSIGQYGYPVDEIRPRSWERKSNRENPQPVMHGAARDTISSPPLHQQYGAHELASDSSPVPPSAKHAEQWSEETRLLAMNWRLLKSLATIRYSGMIQDALNEAMFARQTLRIGSTSDSTEVRFPLLDCDSDLNNNNASNA